MKTQRDVNPSKMPIILGETPSTLRWNRYILFVFWFLQFFFIGYVEFITFVSLVFMGWGGGAKPGEQLYAPFLQNPTAFSHEVYRLN